MSKYPHEWTPPVVTRRAYTCRCGARWVPERTTDVAPGDDCPAALRERIAELERHVGSLHEATAAGMAHERAAVVAYLLARADEADDPWMSFCAAAIEQGEHHHPEGAPDAD